MTCICRHSKIRAVIPICDNHGNIQYSFVTYDDRKDTLEYNYVVEITDNSVRDVDGDFGGYGIAVYSRGTRVCSLFKSNWYTLLP